ncbi:MAG: hypothetical protein JNM56_40030 [Planctomycetia bacterium]|nr:hypothetical protein [Planctomycetia bacterium]
MSVETSACPYCNALLPAGTAPAGQRPTCPRCGELLPARAPEGIQAQLPPLAPATAPPEILPTARPSRRTVRSVVVGIMGVMALLSLAFALSTVSKRRSRDPRPPRPIVVETTPPAIEWPALGWLPADTNAVIAVHLADGSRTRVGREFMNRFQAGGLPVSPAELEKWTGLAAADIDHAVLGVRADGRLIPTVVLAVQTRQPYDFEKVRGALKTTRTSDVGEKKVHHFPPPNSKLPLDTVVWSATPTVLVVGLSKADLEKVPAQPASRGGQLPKPVQEVIGQRIDAGSQLWAAGHAEKWEALGPLFLLTVPKEDFETLKQMRTFGFWLRFGDDLRLRGAALPADDEAQKALLKKWENLKLPNAEAMPKDLEPALRELAETYRLELQDGWLTLQAQSSAETVNKALNAKP